MRASQAIIELAYEGCWGTDIRVIALRDVYDGQYNGGLVVVGDWAVLSARQRRIAALRAASTGQIDNIFERGE